MKRALKKSPALSAADVEREVKSALAWLKRHSSEKFRDGLGLYAIPADHAYGVRMNAVQNLGKKIGRNHAIVDALWDSRVYEARLLVAYVADPEIMTAAQMERWCDDFQNWAEVDTLCFKLFDRSPLAWKKVAPWCRRQKELSKRAGFVLIACLAAHDKAASEEAFFKLLPLIDAGARDERNFVKKGVSWALRMVGRRSQPLYDESIALANRLIDSSDPTARWVGKDALKDLSRPAVKKHLAARKFSRSGEKS